MLTPKTRPVSDFLPRVLAHIDGVDVDMATALTLDAIIQFVRDTHLMREVVCVHLDPCVNSYKVALAGYVSEIISARVFAGERQVANHNLNFRIEGDTLYVDPPNACADWRIELEFATVPRRDADEVPDFIYEEWVEAVTALALSNLYLLTDNEWYNPQAANNQMVRYQQFVRSARIRKVTKHKPFTMRLSNKRRL